MESQDPIYPQLGFDGRFNFTCGPHVSCFVKCCTGTNIWLYPYDVLRISRSLSISTTEFIRDYCRYFEASPPPIIPALILKNAENGEGRCPFAADSGCTVYPDRPWVCRLFPVVPVECRTNETPDSERRFDIFVWEGCRGVGQGAEFSVREWWHNGAMAAYEETYPEWQELVEELKISALVPLTGEKAELFKLGSYDHDHFRSRLLAGELSEYIPLDTEELERAAHDDLFLMQIACRWLGRVLLGK